MKKRMKKLASLLLASAMVFSLAACGSSGNDADGGSDSSDGKTTIKITWWGGDSRHEYTQALLDAYTAENPNVEFEATPAGWEGYFDQHFPHRLLQEACGYRTDGLPVYRNICKERFTG